ncbi:MAG: hypothetical protein M5R36_03100 [Deltaproteobacteria bacterium]|nr:hypothetical protein [Deltaproteobacteria bacterium]
MQALVGDGVFGREQLFLAGPQKLRDFLRGLLEIDGFDQVVHGPVLFPRLTLDFRRFVKRAHENDGRIGAIGVRPDYLTHLKTVFLGEKHVTKDEVRRHGLKKGLRPLRRPPRQILSKPKASKNSAIISRNAFSSSTTRIFRPVTL